MTTCPSLRATEVDGVGAAQSTRRTWTLRISRVQEDCGFKHASFGSCRPQDAAVRQLCRRTAQGGHRIPGFRPHVRRLSRQNSRWGISGQKKRRWCGGVSRRTCTPRLSSWVRRCARTAARRTQVLDMTTTGKNGGVAAAPKRRSRRCGQRNPTQPLRGLPAPEEERKLRSRERP